MTGEARNHHWVPQCYLKGFAKSPKMMHLTVATEQRYEATFGRAIKDGDIDPDSKVDYLAMKDFVDGEKYSITMSTTSHVERELNLIDTILPLLGQRQWLLIRAAPDSGGFVTSDHPVCLIWSRQPDCGFFNSPGFGLKGTEVVFTVSHELAILGTFEGPSGLRDINNEQVALVNGIMVAHSDRQIYSRADKFFYTLADGSVQRGADLLHNLPTNARRR